LCEEACQIVPHDPNHMLEFEPNTLAFMTASLEQCCKRLKNDTPEARKFVAEKLKDAARRGRISMIAQVEAGEAAVAELNGETGGSDSRGWRGLIPSWLMRRRGSSGAVG
jgi:hypothetical protein